MSDRDEIAGRAAAVSNILKTACNFDPEEFARRYPCLPVNVKISFWLVRDGNDAAVNLDDLKLGEPRTAVNELELKQRVLLQRCEKLMSDIIFAELGDSSFFKD